MAAIGPSKTRLQALQKAASKIFRQSYNPTQDRRGSGVLREQLKGETLQNYYYPNNFLTFKYVKEQFPDQYMFDHMEDYRLFIIREYVSCAFFTPSL